MKSLNECILDELEKHGRGEEEIRGVGRFENVGGVSGVYGVLPWTTFKDKVAEIKIPLALTNDNVLIPDTIVVLGDRWWMDRQESDFLHAWVFHEFPLYPVSPPPKTLQDLLCYDNQAIRVLHGLGYNTDKLFIRIEGE